MVPCLYLKLVHTVWGEVSRQRMGNGLGREESGITILGNLGEVCLHKQQKGHQVINKIHSQLSDGVQVFDFYLLHGGDRPV